MSARSYSLAGLVAVALLTACASGGAHEAPGTIGPATQVGRTKTSGGVRENDIDYTTNTTSFVSRDLLAAPLDSVWAVLPEIWKSLGLDFGGISTKEHRLQTGVVRLHRQLGGVSLSRYVECGRSTQGPNADIYFITLSLQTVASGPDGRVTVQSTMSVAGEGTGNSGAVVRCSSLGELERRVAERVALRLKK